MDNNTDKIDVQKLLAEIDELLSENSTGSSTAIKQLPPAEKLPPLIKTEDVNQLLPLSEPEEIFSYSIEEIPVHEECTEPEFPDLFIQAETGKKQRSIGSIISSVLFYTTLVLIVMIAFIIGTGDRAKSIMGYSYANVLTTSMQSEIPKGSLVITRFVKDSSTLNIGDDITYLVESGVTYTHRIINTFENYNDSGMLAFETQGTDNPMPDKDYVYENNIIGKVVFHVPELGGILNYLRENLIFAIILFVILMLLSFSIRMFFTPPKPKEQKLKKVDI